MGMTATAYWLSGLSKTSNENTGTIALKRLKSALQMYCSHVAQKSHDGGPSHSPWADPHQWNWEAGEEDSGKEKGLPPPHIRQSAYEWGTQKREQALYTLNETIHEECVLRKCFV